MYNIPVVKLKYEVYIIMICTNYFPDNLIIRNTEFVPGENLEIDTELKKEKLCISNFYCETKGCGILDFFGFINNEFYLYLFYDYNL